jgi:predicted GH43/DUF377 family glycosyl hydrolase
VNRTDDSLVRRTDVALLPDPSRVVSRLFVAGEEVVGAGDSRASGVVARVLALDEDDVRAELAGLQHRFGPRHRDLLGTFSHHADRIANRLDPAADLSPERWLLLGATFTHEYSIEAAALCNPSIVAHPDQSSTPAGSCRFVLSTRGIGEGHRSSIGFRTGTVGPHDAVTVDDPGPFPMVAATEPALLDRLDFTRHLRAVGSVTASAADVLERLGDTFTVADLDVQLAVLADQVDTRRDAPVTAAALRAVADRSYTARFPGDSELSERVLAPATAVEANGVEDARFVRFVEDDGAVAYLATYTAFDGSTIHQQLLRTTDFVEFTSSPMSGPAAANKGLALFPRRIGGRYAALSRADRETNAVVRSDSLVHWDGAVEIEHPSRPWEVIQLGNCGSPIETAAGWLVLTHAVGPMRTYTIGALLLDLDDPTAVVGTLAAPLLVPDDPTDGYVPNVVYSCGAMLHGDTLVLPHGVADTSIGVVTLSLASLLARMVEPATGGPSRP